MAFLNHIRLKGHREVRVNVLTSLLRLIDPVEARSERARDMGS